MLRERLIKAINLKEKEVILEVVED